MPWPFLVFLIVAGLALVGGIVHWAIAEARRQREFMAWAQGQGWSFTARDLADRPTRFKGFAPFGQGHSRVASNILAKRSDGLDVELFDYRYTIQAGKHSQTHTVIVATAQMPFDGRHLTIVRENLGHKLVDTLGGEDIDIEHDGFSRRFWVQGQDRRLAYDVLHPPMVDFLLQHGEVWSWQWRGRTLLLHRAGRLSPILVRAATDALTGFHKALPRHRLHEVKHAR